MDVVWDFIPKTTPPLIRCINDNILLRILISQSKLTRKILAVSVFVFVAVSCPDDLIILGETCSNT